LNPRPKIHPLGLYILILVIFGSPFRDPPGGRSVRLSCKKIRLSYYRPFGQAILLIDILALPAGKKDRMLAD